MGAGRRAVQVALGTYRVPLGSAGARTRRADGGPGRRVSAGARHTSPSRMARLTAWATFCTWSLP